MPNAFQVYDLKDEKWVNAEIIDETKPYAVNNVARLTVNGEKIGTIIYFHAKEHLEIQMIRNDNKRYSKVGTALFQYALDQSLAYNKNGNLKLQPFLNSKAFWEKFGFQFESERGSDMYLPEDKIVAHQNKDYLITNNKKACK